MVQPRPYQERAINEVRHAIRAGKRRILLTISTGGGKTLVASIILSGLIRKGNVGLFVAHRRELISQTLSTLERVGVSQVGIIRADDPRTDATQPIQIASVQTLARRPRIDPPPSLIFCDECHLSAADGWKKHVFEPYPNAIVIGLSATPERLDGKPLGELYDHLIVGASYSELFAGGWLTKPLVYSTPVLPDLSDVRTIAGDYHHGDLEKAVNKGHLIGNIVDNWLRLAGGRTTIAFAGSVAHSKAIRDAFVMVGVKAEHLDGETPDEERKAILERLANGTTTLVANYGILVEGVDIPPAKCAILARPTKSRVCYMQSAGRVLRPWNGMVPLILDHAGCTDRFDIIGVDVQWSLTEKAKRSPHVPSHRNCPQCFAYVLSTLRQCPHCGTEMPTAPPTSPKDKKMIPVDLALRSVTDVPTAEYAWTQATVRTARNRGWHPKAIQHRFLETFGHPIPESLKSAISQDYKRDEEWKQRRRERRNVTEPSQDQTRTCSKQN